MVGTEPIIVSLQNTLSSLLVLSLSLCRWFNSLRWVKKKQGKKKVQSLSDNEEVGIVCSLGGCCFCYCHLFFFFFELLVHIQASVSKPGTRLEHRTSCFFFAKLGLG